MGKDQRKSIVVCAYILCKQYNPGDGTVTAQQQRRLRMKGDQTPQPRTQWIKDIAPYIHKWQENREQKWDYVM
eukprot:11388734-Ditylum_brightwellii.AAC.1